MGSSGACTADRLAAALAVAATALALAACGSDQRPQPEPAAPVADQAGRDSVVVAALGDSIVAGSPLWDPRPVVREQIGPVLEERSQFEYWAERADPGLDFVNCGVLGERTDQIARRLDSCAKDADVLIVQGGINDIAQHRDVDDVAANLREMVRRGLDRGLEVAIAELLPWNNGFPETVGPIRRLNRRIGRIGERLGVPVLPLHETLLDPAQPGLMADRWTDDGDHPSIEGYRRLGEVAVVPHLPRP